ncbi:MAG: biotin--[acetyl-CoA-carboxylase] ligase [Microthrixaceae bacterium]
MAETDSTNTLVRTLVEELPAGSPPRAVAVADRQVAGRGRLDRRWESPVGATLMMSVAHEVPLDTELLGALPLAMGLGALEAIDEVTGQALGLKWPNDLVAAHPDGTMAKVGGILGESFEDRRAGVRAGGGPRSRVAVLGIGINTGWEAMPPELPEATSLNLLGGAPVDRAALAEAVLARYRAWWGRVADGDREGFVSALEATSVTLGRRVRVELPAATVSGLAEAMTRSGALVVLDDRGVRTEVTVGDVVHLRPEPR